MEFRARERNRGLIDTGQIHSNHRKESSLPGSWFSFHLLTLKGSSVFAVKLMTKCKLPTLCPTSAHCSKIPCTANRALVVSVYFTVQFHTKRDIGLCTNYTLCLYTSSLKWSFLFSSCLLNWIRFLNVSAVYSYGFPMSRFSNPYVSVNFEI